MNTLRLLLAVVVLSGISHAGQAAEKDSAKPVPILQLSGKATDPQQIDYANLPRLPGKLAVINAAAARATRPNPGQGGHAGSPAELAQLSGPA